ncbi:MAG: hypothetical protein U9P73_03990 [Candidatus Cloacimonadota bacterium]|nr:hypothetical protein [Candidatus Cloacimonadota bacterium]
MSQKAKIDYGISNCFDMYEKLKFEGKRLDSDWHEYNCFNFIVTAWHLYDDWLDNDRRCRPQLSIKKKNKIPATMTNVLNAIRDLTNGSKHMVLNKKSVNKQVVTEVHSPEIRDMRSFMTGEAKVGIKIDSTYYSMWDLRYICLLYFAWVFDDNTPMNAFPPDLADHLDRLTQLSSQL